MLRVALVAVLLAACHQDDPGPPCDQVVDHFIQVTRHGPPLGGTRALASRDTMITVCKQRHYDATTRRCLLAARDAAALARCGAGPAVTGPAAPTPGLTPSMPQRPHTIFLPGAAPAPGAPGIPAPARHAGSGTPAP